MFRTEYWEELTVNQGIISLAHLKVRDSSIWPRHLKLLMCSLFYSNMAKMHIMIMTDDFINGYLGDHYVWGDMYDWDIMTKIHCGDWWMLWLSYVWLS